MDRMTPDDARSLAASLHADQRDKAGAPYAPHVLRVGDAVRAAGWPDHVVVAAYLHDAVEDTPETTDSLRARGIDEAAITLIALLTRDDAVSDDAYYAAIGRDAEATAIKRADLDDNADPARLARLDRTMRDRLERKYAHARRALAGADPGTSSPEPF